MISCWVHLKFIPNKNTVIAATHTRDIIEVPIEKIIERIVKVPQETIIEVPVEKCIERVVTVHSTDVVEVPVEKVIERIVRVPQETMPPWKSQFPRLRKMGFSVYFVVTKEY